MPQAAGQGVALEGMPVSRTALTSVLQSSLAPRGYSGVKDQHPPPGPRVGGTAGNLWGFQQREGGRSGAEASLCSGSGVWPTL